MKHNIIRTIVVVITSFLNSEAQTIVPYFQTPDVGSTSGLYYKDLDNDFGPYVGTWLYTNGNTSFKIVLQKKEMVSVTFGSKTFYEDCLIGEYQYIENGTERVNTLSNLMINHTEMTQYNLTSTGIITNGVHPQCNNCPAGQRRISMMFDEPSRRNVAGLSASITLRRITENGVPKIVAILVLRSSSYGFTVDGNPTSIEKHSVPYGTYVLTKIN